ncbi:uncharacterized protein si:ch211-242e8.1 [Chanodichthys erythropterus]|uniref:uncharacterized protein si:ch211-242e8.1 n=1 Tax=Chanodichthys erythropterus TaxID=933992 RepID=UPI00351EB620
MTTSDPTTDEQSINPEYQTEPTDPLGNNTASVRPNMLMTTSYPTTDEQSINPEHQTQPTDPPSNNTASVRPNLLMTTSDPTTDEQSINPEHQTQSTDLFSSNETASVSSIMLITTSDASNAEQSTTPKHQNDSTDPPSNTVATPETGELIVSWDGTRSWIVKTVTDMLALIESNIYSLNTMQIEDIYTLMEIHCGSPQDILCSDLIYTSVCSCVPTGLACISVLPPRRGSYYVEHGTGVSVGSMLVFWCKEGYQLVGHEKITCILHAGIPRWSSYLPVCESIPRPNDQGLRIALLVSVVSGVVILVMTVCFIVCCCQERMSKKKEKQRTGRSRRRETRSSRSRRSPSWLEREQLDWEAFPPPKLFSLSQRLDRPLPPGSPVYSEVIRAYENRGYERSQESLLRSPHTTYPTYHANSQIYPALVFQRVQTEPNPSTSSTTPVYVQISTPPKNKTPHAPSVTHPETNH